MGTIELAYQIALSLLDGVGDKTAKKLVAYCGGTEAVFKEGKKALTKIPGVGSFVAKNITLGENLSRAEQEIKFIEKNNIKPIFYLDNAYPNLLKNCIDSPLLLYVKGNIDFNKRNTISVVGTRNADGYGKKLCNQLVTGLKQNDVLIVSGLAYGIDIMSHRAALQNNVPTVAILAHGLDRVYPQLHTKEAEEMQENGALVTEFLSGTKPNRENFPKRNRIVAGMSAATIVIQSAKKGGSLITANIASSYNRDVFAFPGLVGDKLSEGCHWLIKTNKAALIENAQDLRYAMGWEQVSKPVIQKRLFVELSEAENKLVQLFKNKEALTIDNICLLAKQPTSQVAPTLLALEFLGVVSSLPGKIYKLN